MFNRKTTTFLSAVLLILASPAVAADTKTSDVVDGVAVYFGIVPGELVRGHAPAHPERQMHGGVPAGESHIMIALFDDKTGKRIDNAEVSARVTGRGGLDVQKRLEPMTVAGSLTYGNYFSLIGSGPYRIAVRFRVPGATPDSRVEFRWSRP